MRIFAIVMLAALLSGCATVCIPVEGHDHTAKARIDGNKVCTFGWRVSAH